MSDSDRLPLKNFLLCLVYSYKDTYERKQFSNITMKRSLIILGLGIVVIVGIFVVPMLQDVFKSYPDIDPTQEYTPITESEQSAIVLSPTSDNSDGELYTSFTSNLSECTVRDPHSDYEEMSTFTPTQGEFVTGGDTEFVITCISSAEDSSGEEYLVLYKEYNKTENDYVYRDYFNG